MLGWFLAWWRAMLFGFSAAAAALSPSVYSPRTRNIAVRQIYYTAYQVLPGFTLFTVLLSVIIVQITISLARGYGLAPFALELVFRAIVLELVPLLTAMFVALRSGSAICTEIALMEVSGELDEMRASDLDPYEREFVPRIAASAVGVFALTVVSSTLVTAMTYLVMYGDSPWGFAEFTRTLARVFSPAVMAGFALKSLAFGAVVAVIPISAGLHATRDPKSVPVAVMGGMVRLFIVLWIIEGAALAIKYT
jgi:phospholipid/cholesterol/gamma-HCH transport system permease protein